jgi:WD40 repeat protein
MNHSEDRKPRERAGRRKRLLEIILKDEKAAADGRPLDRTQIVSRNPDLKEVLLDYWATVAIVKEGIRPPKIERPGLAEASILQPCGGGRYELRQELGCGGMGTVHLGRDIQLGRDIAIKVLLEKHQSNQEMARRFVKEARINGRLQHPGIAPVYELGAFPDRRPYFTMKLVRGKTLSELLANRVGLSEGLAWLVGVFGQVCQTVAYAHAQGVIHRDLKPANVMAGAFGEVQVMDWGLAKVMAEGDAEATCGSESDPQGGATRVTPHNDAMDEAADGVHTREGSAMGTPEYMAPEQARGHLSLVDARADVFGLGAILCEILTGGPPFTASGRGALHKARAADLSDAFARLDRLEREKELARLARRCLAEEPGERPRDAGEVAKEVMAYQNLVVAKLRQVELAHAAQAARAEEAKATAEQERKARDAALAQAEAERQAREAAVARTATAQRARRLALGLASVAALAVAALVTLSVVSIQWGVREQDHSRRLGDALDQAAIRLAENYFDHGLVLCERGDVGPGLLWLARALEKAPAEGDRLQKAVRGQLAGWIARVNPLRTCIDNPGPLTAVALSPDGRTLWAADRDKHIRRWRVHDGKSIEPALTFKVPVHEILWRPDGKTVLTIDHDFTAQLWVAETGQALDRPLDHKALKASWGGPSSDVIVTVGKDGKVRLLDPMTFATRRTLPDSIGKITAFAVCPVSDTLFTASEFGTASSKSGQNRTAKVCSWEVATGLPIGEPLVLQSSVRTMAFRLDGKALLVSLDDGHIQIWDVKSRRRLGKSVRLKGIAQSVAFSPDGRTYLTGGSDRTARLWDAATGELAAPPIVHRATVQTVAYGNDGRTFLTAGSDGALRLWGIAPELPRGLVLPHSSHVESVIFSPDGRFAVTGSWDGTVRRWDTLTGEQLGEPMAHRSPVRSVAVSPGGGTILTVTWGSEVYLWTAADDPIARTLNHPVRVSKAVFSPDGRKVLTGGNDGSVRFWDMRQGVVVHEDVNAHPGGCTAVAFSPDGFSACTAGADGTARLWDAVTCQQRGPVLRHNGTIWSVAFSRDGLLTGCDDHRARLWDMRRGEFREPAFWHGNSVKAVALSPDGKVALTGSKDGTARLWSTNTGKPIGPPLTHGDQVISVAFSTDGGMAVTGSLDGTARVWEVATGKAIDPPLLHSGRVSAVAFSPDGRLVLTGSFDNTARLWAQQRPALGTAELIALRAEVLTGLQLDDNDNLRVIDTATWHARRARLAELAASAP